MSLGGWAHLHSGAAPDPDPGPLPCLRPCLQPRAAERRARDQLRSWPRLLWARAQGAVSCAGSPSRATERPWDSLQQTLSCPAALRARVTRQSDQTAYHGTCHQTPGTWATEGRPNLDLPVKPQVAERGQAWSPASHRALATLPSSTQAQGPAHTHHGARAHTGVHAPRPAHCLSTRASRRTLAPPELCTDPCTSAHPESPST